MFQWRSQTSVSGGVQPVAYSPGVRGWGGKLKGVWGTELGPEAEPRKT